MSLIAPITEVSLLAKEQYCFWAHRGFDYIINKIRIHKKLSFDEVEKYEQLTKEILSIVNQKATPVSGLSKNNPRNAKLLYKGLIYIITYNQGPGKVVTVQTDSGNWHQQFIKKRMLY